MLKQFFLWWVSKLASEAMEARTPYFAMTMPVNSALWLSPMWKRMKGLQANLRWTSSGMVRCATNLAMTWPREDWEAKGPGGQLQWTLGFQPELSARGQTLAQHGDLMPHGRAALSDDKGRAEQMDATCSTRASTLQQTMQNLCGGQGDRASASQSSSPILLHIVAGCLRAL